MIKKSANALKTHTLPDNLGDEINVLETYVERFKKDDLSLMEFKVQRVPFGVYEQRKKDTYMIRIRCAGACVRPDQLKKIAEISQVHGADYIHLTSRQEIQLHYVLVDSIVPVMWELKAADLASRGGGGNTVRNIMAQEDAGIAEDEAFDVTPYAIELTSRLVVEPDSWNLPRKFKFAFSGSSDDRGYATLHDVGYIAKIKDGVKGFTVYVAGGMGAKAMLGNLLFDFIPDTEVYNVAKATKNLFYKNGNRKNKHASRLRFLWKQLGGDEFKRIFFEEYEAVKKENYLPLAVKDIDNVGIDPNSDIEQPADQKDYELWKKRFVQSQRQEGLNAIILPIHLGHVDNDKAIKLAEFLMPFGENVIRIRKDQNFLIRNIMDKYLPNLYNMLKDTFDNFNRPFIIDKVLACAGASTCQLGICLSPGAATATKRYLETCDLDLDAVSDAKVNISGCPNSCGQHHVADLGFFGKVARRGDKVHPAYNVLVGSLVKEGETEFAQKVGEIAARDMPFITKAVFKSYLGKRAKYETFRDYMRSDEGKEDVKALCVKYKSDIPDYEVDKNYYLDWGTDKTFSVAERGKGECSAGIFDLIESDLGHIQQAKKLLEEINENGGDIGQKQTLLRDVIYYSARILLISKALEPQNEKEVYSYFREHFINTGLIAASFDEIIKLAEAGDFKTLIEKEDQVFALADRLKYLYDVMDSAFRYKLKEGDSLHNDKVDFIPVVHQAASASAKAKTASTTATKTADPALVKDFRGVGCPMNFVKTKMELAKLKSKDILEIWLDDGQPIENVPGSVREEGHTVLEQQKTDEGYWSVVIEKQ